MKTAILRLSFLAVLLADYFLFHGALLATGMVIAFLVIFLYFKRER